MIDIIVPVFNAASDLERCLEALLRHTESDQRVLLINDASTDPAVVPLLEGFVGQRRSAQLLHNPTNLGFIGTCNLAMSASGHDVVLLNSDAQVTSGWLEALRRCAASDARIATATPFSNNAEICSIPDFCVNNPIPDNPARWARAVSATGSRTYPELPTGVGFCLYVRRAALDELGLFDPRYGRGYGEENDFCRRAAAAGWRNVLCDDAYVLHAGGKSFGPLNLKPNGENLQVLLERYPDYEQLVADFIARDPLKPIRHSIMAKLAETH
ncbi:MAG: glycosyltransferase family 2 protein [Pseudomonadota bacterium]